MRRFQPRQHLVRVRAIAQHLAEALIERAERAAAVAVSAAILERCAGKVFICGGAQVYREALPLAQVIYLTRVHATLAGDTRFPELAPADWELAEQKRLAASTADRPALTFQLYTRR